MSIFDVLQIVGGMILSIGYIPQIHQITKTRSVNDLNLKTFIFVLVGISMMEVYAVNLFINGSGLAFLITNSISLFIAIVLVILIAKFRKRGDDLSV